MGALYDRIQADMKEAMKAKDQVRLGTIRMLKSEIQYELSKTGAKEIDDPTLEVIIKKAVKKRKDSIEQYEAADRKDLADNEKEELKVLEHYLPEELTEEQLQSIIEETLASINATSPSDMGKAMGAVMGRLKGQNADGSLVKSLVEKKLKS